MSLGRYFLCSSIFVLLLAAVLPILLSEVAGGWTAARKSGFDPSTSLPNLSGKFALVTGASTGIGRVTAVHLARRGATVLVHARSEQKARPIVNEIAASGGTAEPVLSDFSSMASVGPMAQEVSRLVGKGRMLDMAILNAGLCKSCMGSTDAGFEMTQDGFELHIQVNHLAHQLLVEKLIKLGTLGNASRLVSVSSALEARSYPEGMRYGNWKAKGEEYTDGQAYGQSKLANVMMASEVHRRFGMQSVSVHPGIIVTDLGRYSEAEAEKSGGGFMKKVAGLLFGMARMTTEQGTYTQLWAATVFGLTDGFYHPVGKPVTPHPSFNAKSSAKLWDTSHDYLKKYL